MSDSTQVRSTTPAPKSKPELRHEFVGMMFAVAIGEVGLQTASLVRAGHLVHFLPAYFHLLLSTILIATSWVGWTLSQTRGGQRDVDSIFQREFLELLFDVALVILYFILVKQVDFVEEGGKICPNVSAKPEASWIFFIFCVYVVWDIVSKWPWNKKEEVVRMVPTVLCAVAAYFIRYLVQDTNPPHVLTADIALLALVLLFRALKELTSALFPSHAMEAPVRRRKRDRAIRWSALLALVALLGVVWTTRRWPLPEYVGQEIQKVLPSERNCSQPPAEVRDPATP
ncbi:MAG: hypothetical protein WCA49_13090 [Candidatus Sulfotelmatobacter sp.]